MYLIIVRVDFLDSYLLSIYFLFSDGVVLQVLAVQVVVAEAEVETDKDKTTAMADGHHGHAPHISHRGVVQVPTEAAAGRVTSIRLMTIDGVI